MNNRSNRGRPRISPSNPLTWREDIEFLIVTLETLGGVKLFADADLERYRAIYMAYMGEEPTA